MELTRREAVAALAAAGITIGGGAAVLATDGKDNEPFNWGTADHDLATMQALVEVLFPSEVTATDEFVETYVFGRIEDDEAYRDAISEAVASLDGRADKHYGTAFADLDISERDQLLYDIGMTTAEPDPEGTDVKRMRYYLVNELLFALFTTPQGGELVGAENPTGHPGGIGTYQRGPQR